MEAVETLKMFMESVTGKLDGSAVAVESTWILGDQVS